ncbi:MAG TPA: carbohydrate ABC transporter permease [Thermoanaerobaculia bacterium]|nr:carbohydrate ABC transporter permease [Thermoanaerobaculia bacterium]
MRRRLSRFAAATAIHATLLALAVASLVPLAWMVSASFMPQGEATAFPPALVPSRPTLDNYVDLFARLKFGRALANSILFAATVTAISLLLNTLAGYALAKLRFRRRERIFDGLVAALVLPSQVAMLPLFLMLRALGFINTAWGVVLPGMASLFGIFLVRQYALSLPDELLDAARVDGASEFRIYRSIVLPLCRPILVSLGIFTFLGSWNDFLWPLIVLSDERRQTLPVALANLLGEHALDIELMMAGAVLTVLPVLVLFLAFQRYYIEGITLGSVKE